MSKQLKQKMPIIFDIKFSTTSFKNLHITLMVTFHICTCHNSCFLLRYFKGHFNFSRLCHSCFVLTSELFPGGRRNNVFTRFWWGTALWLHFCFHKISLSINPRSQCLLLYYRLNLARMLNWPVYNTACQTYSAIINVTIYFSFTYCMSNNSGLIRRGAPAHVNER